MRKTLLVITVLLFAAQAYAGTVTMSVGDEGGRWAAIRYSADANVSGFGLKVTADSGASFTDIKDFNVGECTASVQGYGIFPGTIDVNELTGVVDDNGTPVAPNDYPGASGSGFGTGTLVLEMGALYVEGNEPALSGTLILVKVDGDCTVCVDTEPVRGNIVLTDACEAIVVYSPNCVYLQQVEYDYGDADDPTYPTLLASTGARHAATGVILGVNRDIEADGQPSPNADLDDNTGVPDDEDGITNLVATLAGGNVTVTVTGACLLNAWIDFTNDGDWADAGEQIFNNQALAAGVNNLQFNVPAGAVVETDLISRWRVNDAGNLGYTGDAADGEVEDYNDPNIRCHVPDVVGDPCDAAIAEIIANGFTIGNITTEPNGVIALNAVISTDPPYCNYPGCDTPVDLVVSEGSGDPNAGTCWDIVNECGAQYAPDAATAAATGLGGDSDCTGNVDFGDLAALKRSWGRTKGVDPEGCLVTDAGKYCCCTDFNHDGAIDFGDLSILKVTWGNTGALPATGEQSCPP